MAVGGSAVAASATAASIHNPASLPATDRWTRYNATVLTICILGWAFDNYEQTIMQLVTPLLIRGQACPQLQWLRHRTRALAARGGRGVRLDSDMRFLHQASSGVAGTTRPTQATR